MPEPTEQHPPAGTIGANPAPAATADPGDTGGTPSRRELARRYIRSKGNDAERAVALLQKDFERVDGELARAKLRPAAPAGAVVLTGDEATAYAAYQALGKPTDVKARLDKAAADATFRAEREAADHTATVAGVAGYKARVLTRLARDLPAGAALEVRDTEVDEDGEKVKRPAAYVVTGTGDAAKTEALALYAAREWADFLPALRGDAEGAEDGAADDRSPPGRATRGTAPAPAGTRYPEQHDRGAPPKVDALKSIRAGRTNPSQWGAAGTPAPNGARA